MEIYSWYNVCNTSFTKYINDCKDRQWVAIQVNMDVTDSMGPGKLFRHMQNPSYTYDEYLICIGKNIRFTDNPLSALHVSEVDKVFFT